VNILFCEDRAYYDLLGLEPLDGVNFTFGGMKFYKASDEFLSCFDMFVCAFYFSPPTVLLTLKFKRLGVRTAIVADGIFDLCNAFNNRLHKKNGLIQFHTILQDYFICVGSEEVNYFKCCDYRVRRYMPKRIQANSSMVPLPLTFSVLITTANTAYFDENEFKSLVILLQDVCNLLASRNVSYSVRLMDSRLYDELCLRVNSRIFNDTEDDFETTLQRYSSVISTPSSVVITSMLHKRSTAILVYRDYPILTQAGWLLASAESFKVALEGFLNHESDRMLVQERLRAMYIATPRLSSVLRDSLVDDNFCPANVDLYVNRSLYNMLNSPLNFNLTWTARTIYLRLSKIYLFQSLIRWFKNAL
jgi:hypothetical protein